MGRSSILYICPCLVLLLGSSPVPAQTPPQPLIELPPFTFQAAQNRIEIGTGSNAGRSVLVLTGNVQFTWGDVTLKADKLVLDQKTQRGEASGNVVLTRGDETIRGDFFILDGSLARFDSQGATAVSPPFYVR